MTTVSRALVLLGWILVAPATALGSPIFDVSIDTSSLVTHTGGPFTLMLAFIDGEGFGDGNNLVELSAFRFGGGTAVAGTAVGVGGTSGDLEVGVRLADTSFLTLFFQDIVPGNTLDFLINFTDADDSGAVPDAWTLALLDGAGVPVPTLAPVGDYLLRASLSGAGPVIEAFGSDPTRSLTVGGIATINQPLVQPVGVPEPTTLGLLTLGGIVAWRRTRIVISRRS